MPIFEYRGVDGRGKNVAGILEAESVRAAKLRLRKDGVFLTDMNEGKEAAAVDGQRRQFDLRRTLQRVTPLDLAVMTRQFSTLVRAGIPLVDSLTALVDQTDNEKLKRVLSQVKDRVNEGSSLADAMAPFPKVFSFSPSGS